MLAVLVVCGSAVGAALFLLNPMNELPIRTIDVGGNAVVVEIASTPAARERGLSGRTALPQGRGMLFEFDADAEWGIWMKDMHVAIDIVWLDADGTVVHIERAIGPETYPTSFKSTSPARYVLELPAGYMAAAGVGVGQKIVVQ